MRVHMNKKTRKKPVAKLKNARHSQKKKTGVSQLERLIEEAEADVAAGRVEDFDLYMKRLEGKHNLSSSGDFDMTETVLRQVRDRLGPLSGEAEQAVTEALEIVRRMNGSSLSPPVDQGASDENFKGENAELQEYLSWTDDRQEQYQSDAENLNAKWSGKKMRDLNAMWLIVIDGKVVASGYTLRTFPFEEEFDALCEKTGKYPFVLFGPLMLAIEETRVWHSTVAPNDSYPTIRVNVKTDKSELELEADFDTGAMDTYLDFSIFKQQGAMALTETNLKKHSSHLGRKYSYTAKSIWLEVKDKNEHQRRIRTNAICVENWRNSPFVIINPTRVALVGRDTMLGLQPMILLDFAKRQTTVEYSVATNPT